MGFFGMTIGYFQKNALIRDLGMFLLIPVSISFYSIALSKESDHRLTQLGEDSKHKLDTIGNAIFMEIVDVFEDKRIQLLQHPDWLGIEGTIWKCKTYVDRAIDLKESTEIDKENQHRLFEWYDYLIHRTRLPWDDESMAKLKKNDVINMIRMGEKLQRLDLSLEDKEKLSQDLKFLENFKEKMDGEIGETDGVQ